MVFGRLTMDPLLTWNNLLIIRLAKTEECVKRPS